MLDWLVVLGLAAGVDPQAVSACAVIDDDRQRLACYDGLFRPADAARSDAAAGTAGPPATSPSSAGGAAAAVVPAAAPAAPPIVASASAAAPVPQAPSALAASGPAAPASPTEKFGLSAEQIEARRPQAAPEIESIDSRVVAVKALPRDRFVLTLENGQVWEQTEPTPRQRFYPGDTVEIRKAALGSFLASGPNSGERIRVKRQR